MFECVCGPMFSGKTRELFRRADAFQSIGKRCVYISPTFDTRSKDAIECHTNETRMSIKVKALRDVTDDIIEDADVILVDEMQFFEPEDARGFVHRIDKAGKYGMCSSLVGDSDCVAWETFTSIVPLMDDISFLRAYCIKCGDGTKAAFTKRTASSTDRVHIGAGDSYMPCCKAHL